MRPLVEPLQLYKRDAGRQHLEERRGPAGDQQQHAAARGSRGRELERRRACREAALAGYRMVAGDAADVHEAPTARGRWRRPARPPARARRARRAHRAHPASWPTAALPAARMLTGRSSRSAASAARTRRRPSTAASAARYRCSSSSRRWSCCAPAIGATIRRRAPRGRPAGPAGVARALRPSDRARGARGTRS